jgi:hypothetical protein
MKKREKTQAIPHLPSRELGFVLFLILGIFVVFTHARADEEPASCSKVKRYDSQIESLQSERDTLAGVNNADSNARLPAITSALERVQTERALAKADCDADNRKRTAESDKCKNLKASEKKYFEYDKETGRCEEKEFGQKSNPESGECNNAELFRGTNWKGEACKNTANTVKDVKVRQDAVNASAQAIATTYSAMQAQQTTGYQQDAQARQQKILQALAITKFTTGGLQLAGAAQLKSSAGEAETAASSISSSHKEIAAKCANETAISEEACFYREASEKGLPSDKAAYANFERMKSASTQSQEQADAANNLAKANMVTGLADTLVGLQALQMSRQAQQNAMGMGLPPQAPMIPGYRLGGGQSGGLSPGLAPGTGTANPTDFGVPGGGPGEFGVAGGGVGNGIKAGKGFATTPGMKVERSGVSSAGGGGGAGSLRGGGGNNNQKKSAGRTGNTAGEYQVASGGGAGFRGGAGAAKDEKNPFAEALAKLFPPDKNGNPVVDSRELASEQPMEAVDESAYVGSEVYASDPSIFEQIKAKYQQLANNGRI